MRGWVVGVTSLLAVSSAGTAALLARPGPEVVAAMDASGTYVTEAPTTSTSSTAPSTAPPSSTTAPQLPSCEPGDEPAEGDPVEDWATMVLDPAHRLPEGFEPPGLLEVSRGSHGEILIRDIVVPDLVAMLDAAEAAGSPLTLVSGYRSYEYQVNLFQEAVDELGEEDAAKTTALPGHSEHQLGTAVDVLAPGLEQLTPAFADTPAGRWLAENAHRHGFVVSYPESSAEEACYEYEPWHLRYVGRDNAREIVESGLTPREWMLTR